ncbi:MAG TPA: ankyrin repeat domain-containing protein, partial [Labilithrix sp.]|nr:ankyrin repeat domain-containing protein [Labilithrix sp.]
AVLLSCTTLAGCGRHESDVVSAIARGRGAVELAIENGGSVNPKGGSRRVPLLEAANAGDAEIVSLLLARGARIGVSGEGGATPLHLAARRGHHASVAILAAAMSTEQIDAVAGPRRRTALHDAAASGSIDAVSALLRAGANPKKADSFGQSPLHLLAVVDPVRAAAIARVLLQAGADPIAADARGFSPLHAAAASDNVPLVRELAPRSQLEMKTPAGETALDVALRHGRDRAGEVLLAAGAALERDDAWPPLHDAARMDAVERAANLMALPADTRRRAHDKTALEIAVEHGSKRVEALLRERAR